MFCNPTATKKKTIMEEKTISKKEYAPSIAQARETLLSGPPPSRGGKWVTDLSNEQTKQIIVKSFAGNECVTGEPISEWMVNHITWTDLAMKQNCLDFMLHLVVFATSFPKNPLVLSKTMANGDEDSSFAGAIVFNEYNVKKENHLWNAATRNFRLMAALLRSLYFSKKGDIPALISDKKYKDEMAHLETKVKQVDPMLKWHKEFAPSNKHWYLEFVAVDPECQGMGVGSDMMKRVVELADEQGMDCYLEAGGKNKAYYERFGFQVQGERVLQDLHDPTREPIRFYCMARYAPPAK